MGLRQWGAVGGLEMAYTYIADLNVALNYCQISVFMFDGDRLLVGTFMRIYDAQHQSWGLLTWPIQGALWP
jgi:hypothetical protein